MILLGTSVTLLLLGMLAGLIRRPRWRSVAVAGLLMLAAALLIIMCAHTISADTSVLRTSAPLAILGPLHLVLSPLRALFILITACVFAASICFAVREAETYPAHRAAVLLALVMLLLLSMLAVLLSGDLVAFVFSWEIMSIALWTLVNFDHHAPGTPRAGLLTIAISEAGALAGLLGLALLAAAAGSDRFADIAAAVPQIPPGQRAVAFALTFFGFGVKTGIMPVNVWMADAYAAAPRCITPLLSGATLNLGVFALWIMDAPLAMHAPWLALIVLATGALTALLGIVYALISRDITRLLTHSSIENMGIVVAGLGAGFAFLAIGKPVLGGIALVAGLYHMLNHSAYKTLLFLGSGAMHRATGTRELDELGGLMRRLPVLSTLFLIGVLSIAALPPFNGFVSEWLTLESLLRVVKATEIPVRIVFALAGAVLALAAGLTLTCFVMLAGSSLLGLPRSRSTAQAASASRSALWPMGVLAFVCLGLGILPTAVIPHLARLVQTYSGVDASPALVPAFFHFSASTPHAVDPDLVHALTPIGVRIGHAVLPLRGLAVLHPGGPRSAVVFAMSTALSFAVLGLLLALTWLVFRTRTVRKPDRGRAWIGGLHRLRPEMTYTASAFAAPVRVLFDALLHPVTAESTERHGAFTTAIRRRSQTIHVLDRLALYPVIAWGQRAAAFLARMHHGRITLYAAYVLIMLTTVLLVASATSW